MYEIYEDIVNVRRNIFKEVTRIAYSDEYLIEALENAPMKILPGEVSLRRESIFKERAIVGEILRLTLGLPVRKASDYRRISEGISSFDVKNRVYEPPLVNVISFACNACPTEKVEVTSNCRKCVGHPCLQVCPVKPNKAIYMGTTQSHIDTDKCIRCGRCISVCPYNAIIEHIRPCAEACGVNAISSDEYGRAKIDYDKCVSCGQCMSHCPFGAIADKSQIYQLIKSIRTKNEKHIAMIAPAFISQFGSNIAPNQIFSAIKQLGFDDVIEVSLGADIETLKEAKEYLEKVPNELPYLATSCCPAWVSMVENLFPEIKSQISGSLSPMKSTVEYIRSKEPLAKIIFIGPCVAKKLEAISDEMKCYIDFVITFEELMGMFEGKNINISEIHSNEEIDDASSLGRGFAIAGGVAGAIKALIKEIDPQKEVLMENADNLKECVKMARLAKVGKKNGYLLEGMACPGGCIAGAGTLSALSKARKEINQFMQEATHRFPHENPLVNKESL